MREILKTALDGFSINDQALDRLCLYYDLVIDWNKHTNLTAVTEPGEFVNKHIIDSLYPTKFLEFNGSLADIGTGAGFPGLPLKILNLDIDLCLADASAKRVDFLRHCCTELGLEAQILHARAEDMGRGIYREGFAAVTTRAVASLSVISEYCLPLLSLGGVFAALKGPSGNQEALEAGNSIKLLGGEIQQIHNYSLPTGDERSLIVIAKINPTPEKYPRRAGVPAKKPL